MASHTAFASDIDLCPDTLIESNNVVKEIWTNKQSVETLEKTYDACKNKSAALLDQWIKAKGFASSGQANLWSKNDEVIDFIRILGQAIKKINENYCNIQVSNVLKFKDGGELKQAYRYKVFINYALAEEFDSETTNSIEKLNDIILNYKNIGTECVKSFF